MIRLLRQILISVLAVVAPIAAIGQEDLRLLTGVGFDTFFDNTEYTGTKLGRSETTFAARLSPKVGLQWSDKNSLVVGADIFANFGEQGKFLSKARPQLYYRFATPKVKALAGIFDRNELKGYYSEVFISDVNRFYENRLHGFMGQYAGERGHIELALDWCGMYSKEARERFCILSAGHLDILKSGALYGGYALQVFHYAGSEQISGSVVDNIIVNPYIGSRFKAFFDFDIKLHAIVAMHRDRAVESNMRFPGGAMLQLRIQKWGVYLEEQLYTGGHLMPYYYASPNPLFPQGYGADLHYGNPMYGTKPHWVSDSESSLLLFDTRVGYSKSFFNDSVSVNAFIAIQSDCVGCGTRQMVELKVRLFKDFASDKRR